jgi:hypothetical protein
MCVSFHRILRVGIAASDDLIMEIQADGHVKSIDVNHGLGKGLRSFLRQIVPDAAGDDPVCIFAGEFLAIG